jgi:hypothetical protein
MHHEPKSMMELFILLFAIFRATRGVVFDSTFRLEGMFCFFLMLLRSITFYHSPLLDIPGSALYKVMDGIYGEL